MQNTLQKPPKFEWTHLLMLMPFILALGIAPLALHANVINYPALPVSWKNTTYTVVDLFTYSKSIITIFAALFALVLLYFRLTSGFFNKKLNKIPLILLIATAGWLFLTGVTSIFPHAALWGALEKYEGSVIWISYLIIALYAASLFNEEYFQISLLRIILFSGLVITGLGLTQFLSHDLIRTPWFMNLIMPKEMAASASFSFEANRVYSTLYNPNFVAMYVATIFPLAVFMVYKEQNKIFKSLWALFSILLIINQIGSKSNGGYFGLILAGVALVYLILSKHFSLKKVGVASISLAVIGLIVVASFIAGAFNNKLGIPAFKSPYNLEDISITEFQTVFTYKGKQLFAQADPVALDTVRFYNADEVQLNVNAEPDGTYSIISPDFADIRFTTGATEAHMGYINFIIDGANWTFLLHPNGMMYINNFSTTVPIESSKGSGGFVGHEDFGSARGYIWSRTLPLIAASPLVGYGADNFTIAFPQNDYLTKYKLYGTPNIIVDKAHNLFLQMTMNFGLVGFGLLLALIGYAVKSLYISYHSKEGEYRINLVLILCIVGYLGSGQFYDSNLHVSPFFWTFVGCGFKDLFSA